jgi:hypothetical protein
VVRLAADTLGDERQHDVAAVAVRELFARRNLLGVAVQDGEELLGGREFLHGDRHDVLVEVVVYLPVEQQLPAHVRVPGAERTLL